MINVNRHWYQSSYTWLSLLLLPLSWVFRLLVNFRLGLYRFGIKKKYEFNIPVIVVGNITVGGTGKTPFVIWLANCLKEQGYKPGIVSRGYGGKETLIAPQAIAKNSDPAIAGDEAVLLAERSNCPVMVGINRVDAVKTLLASTDCNIVISDDGLQHYKLGRQLEIAMVDGERRFGNQCFLPAGPLREAVGRLKKVDFVVAQQGAMQNEYEMQLFGEQLVSVKNPLQEKALTDLAGTKVHAVAAIGNPKRFFASLKDKGLDVIPHVFPDHYLYEKIDLDFADDLPVVMTEKDAVKCRVFANKKFWFLSVEAKMDSVFRAALLKKIDQIVLRIKNANS